MSVAPPKSSCELEKASPAPSIDDVGEISVADSLVTLDGDQNWRYLACMQVLCAFSVYMCTWGLTNAYGAFQTFYKVQLLRDQSESNIAWIGSIQNALLSFISLLIGPLNDAGYTRHLIVVGSLLTVFGLMMASIASTYWQLILSQGVTVGIGIGMLYVPGISIIPQYFVDYRVLALGLASLGGSVGGIIFPLIISSLIPKVGFGWTMRVLGFIVFALMGGLLAMIRPRKRPTKLRRLMKATSCDGAFIIFCAAWFFGFMGVYIPSVYVQQYAMEACGTSAKLASYMLTILNCGSLLGRFIPNYAADRVTGPMNIHVPMAICASLLAFVWIVVDNTAGIVVFCVLYGFFSATFLSLGTGICCSLTEDLDAIGTRIGIATGSCGMGLLIGNPIAGVLLDNGGWTGLQAFTGALIMCSTLLVAWARTWKYGTRIMIKV